MNIYEKDKLPRGYRRGAHWSNSYMGQSGYWIWRDSDGAAIQARVTPCSEDSLYGPNEGLSGIAAAHAALRAAFAASAAAAAARDAEPEEV